MTAAAPLRRSRCGGAAAVAAVLLLAMSAHAVVFCRWTGSEYVCSGEGDTVTVNGGGYYGDIVVTNIVGVCTNCVAMSPGYVRDWKSSALDLIGSDDDTSGLMGDLHYVIFFARDVQQNLSAYTNTCEVSPWRGYPRNVQNAPRNSITNFMHSVGAFQSDTPKNKAASLARDTYSASDSLVAAVCLQFVAFYDGAAMTYNDFAPNAKASVYNAQDIERYGEQLHTGIESLRTMVEQLSDEECTNQWDGASGGGSGGGESGGGSTIVTNQISGNWCTYDQGEAIKELLDDIKEWSEKQTRYLQAISNRVASIDETIKSALFTSYTHIPTEDELQTSWQDLYLSGGNDNFPEYPATNIVARIELLLAGISGVLTNVNDYASQDGFADESLDSTNLVETAIGDMTNEFVNVMQGRASSARSVGDALIGLYQKFRTWSGTPFSVENLINSYSVELEDGKSLDIPGFAAPAKTLSWANLIRVVCRSAMSVIWILMTVAVFVRFQIAFFQWCFKYVKWAVEVLQGLFV